MKMVPLGWTLLVLHFLRHASADEWCNPNTKFYCNTTGNQLIDLSCGWCRSWTFASNICGNKLRIVGLDGGALPGDGDPTRDYMVETSLDQEFNLTQGDKWKLSLIPQGYPKLKGGALWSNPSNTTLINYGGRSLDDIKPNRSDLAMLDVPSDKWSIVSSLISIQRLMAGVSVNVPELGKAYYIGGFESANYTSKTVVDDGLNHFATTMIQYDTAAKVASQIDAPFLPVQYGAVSYIPINGGALIYFGGETPPSTSASDNATFAINSWDYVWVYDISHNKWYHQPTTGTTTPRSEFCTSTLFDPISKTWQIWVIGGGDIKFGQVVDTVSVLSIPAFRYFEAGPAIPRMATSCQSFGSQIFVIGGRVLLSPEVPSDDYPAIAFVYDAVKQGAVSSFVPTSTHYTAPSNIASAITESRTPEIWADPAVQALFQEASIPSREGNGIHLSKGEIAGISVGVVVFIVLFIVLSMICLTRRRKARGIRRNETGASSPMDKPELDATPSDPKKIDLPSPASELDSDRQLFEMPNEPEQSPFEMASDLETSRYEMAGDEGEKKDQKNQKEQGLDLNTKEHKKSWSPHNREQGVFQEVFELPSSPVPVSGYRWPLVVVEKAPDG